MVRENSEVHISNVMLLSKLTKIQRKDNSFRLHDWLLDWLLNQRNMDYLLYLFKLYLLEIVMPESFEIMKMIKIKSFLTPKLITMG